MKNLLTLLATGIVCTITAAPGSAIAQKSGTTTSHPERRQVAQFMAVAWENKGYLVTENGGKSWRLIDNEAIPQLPEELIQILKKSRGEEAEVSVMPNPAIGPVAFRYTLQAGGTVAITLHDTRGAMVLRTGEEQRLAGDHMQHIDVSSLPSGIYYYRIARDGGSVGSGTVTIAR